MLGCACHVVPMQTSHDLLTSGEAAAVASVSVDTIRRWEKAGRVKALRTPTGHRRFKRIDVERLLSDGTESEAPAAMGGAA